MRVVGGTLVLLMILITPGWGQEVVRIGALAYRGDAQALRRWSPTAAYLSQTIPGMVFRIVPLDLEGMDRAVREQSVDFVLSNPGNYVMLEARYGATRIVTLEDYLRGRGLTHFGAVIFTRADRDDIRALEDLRGKRFMAVSRDAFGGFQMAWRELHDHGLDPFTDLEALRFAGFPQDQIVLAVLSGQVDAGTVRTDILEYMAEEGEILLEEIRVINRREVPGFPSALSTRLYPEWPFARLNHTPEALAKLVAQALLAMPGDSRAARASRCSGWTIPLDYTPVHELFRELGIGPYADSQEVSLGRVMRQYGQWVGAAALSFLLMWVVMAYVVRVNRALSASQRSLVKEVRGRKEAQAEVARERDRLEHRVVARTRELSRVNQALAADIEARKRVEEILGRNQGTLRRLHGLSLATGEDHKQKLRRLLKLGCHHLGVSIGLLSAVGEQGYEVCLICGVQGCEEGGRLPEETPLLADVVRSGRLVEWYREGGEAQVGSRQRWVSYLGCPVYVEERVHCVLEFASTAPLEMPLTAMDREIVQLMAQWVGTEIERQRAEERIQQHQAELAHVARLSTMGEMASGLAHELNQPLTAVVNYTSGCLRRLENGDFEGPGLVRAMESAVEAASRASEIVRHLRGFVRKGQTRRERFDLNEAVDGVLSLVTRKARQEGVELEFSAQDRPLMVEANRIQIEQVVLNLVMNAIEAVAEGPGDEARVEVSTRAAPEGAVELVVKDNGPGFGEDHAEALFSPFYTTKPEGMGMGLSISRTIIEAHGGRLLAEFTPRAGAEFRFTMPDKEAI